MNANSAEVLPSHIEAMLQPAFYPHPCEAIALRQTHISFVVLTGLFAYKLKKRVVFDFLDYESLEKRHFYCKEELRVNRRFSPELYLCVVPIRVTLKGHFKMGEGEGEIVDYAVKMRQFDESNILLEMLERGRLTYLHLELLGRRVATFHQSLKGNEALSEYGRLERVSEVVEANFLETRKYIGRGQARLQFEETKQFARDYLDRHADWFFHRRFGKHIRECHGDLHLGNVFFADGEVHLFDAIEFNQNFTQIDVIYEIAFTVVDLEVRGKRNFAYAFLNAYLERTGDYGGAVLLPFYCSVRAYVLAKVSSILMDDPLVSLTQKDKAAERAKDFYRLSWTYTLARPRRLFVMSGLSGSGKTHVGRFLSRELGLIQIRSDVVRKHLAEVALDEKADEALYSEPHTTETYQQISEMGLFLTENGVPALIDARFAQRSWRMMLREAAKERAIDLLFIHCVADEAVLRARLNARTACVSDADASLLADQIEKWEAFLEDEREDSLVLVNNEPWSTQVEERLMKKVALPSWEPKSMR